MKIDLLKIEQKGYLNRNNFWTQTNEERKRSDICSSKLYLVKYSGTWLIGRFAMQWYGWNFDPNLGVMSMQIEHLEEIYEIQGLEQKVNGDTASHILNYLAKENKNNDE